MTTGSHAGSPRRGRRIAVAAVVAAALALVAVGIGVATMMTASGASSATVRTAENPALASPLLVDRSGMTVYHLSAERNGRFICDTPACLSLWTPLTVGAGHSPTGLGLLGTVRRPDGTLQVTYRGNPLYTFRNDAAPGDLRGNGFRDMGTWLPMTTGAGSSAPPVPPATGSTTRGYGY